MADITIIDWLVKCKWSYKLHKVSQSDSILPDTFHFCVQYTGTTELLNDQFSHLGFHHCSCGLEGDLHCECLHKLFISTEKGESCFLCNLSLSITHLECHITKCVCLWYQLQSTSSTLLRLLLDLDVKFRNKVCYLASGRTPTQLETHGMMPATKGWRRKRRDNSSCYNYLWELL